MSIKHTCKKTVQATLEKAWNVRPPTLRNRIVYYHSVHPTLPLSTSPDVFEQHIVLAKGLGYRFITHQEVRREIEQVDALPWIAIGFDDGYEDNFSHANPVLIRQEVPATFFVVAGQIHTNNEYPARGYQLYPDRQMMSTSQLRNLTNSGHEVASHGLQHELATTVVKSAGRNLAAEYQKSRTMLSDWTGTDVVSYSYPNGQHGAYSAQTRAAVIAAGFKTAAVTVWGTVKPTSDPFTLPRCEISAEDDLDSFARKLTGKHDFRTIAHRLRRNPTWVENSNL